MNNTFMLLIENCNAIQAFSVLLPFITLLVGAWIGNRYAIGRDQRKELLLISVPIHEALKRQLAESEPSKVFDKAVSSDDLLRLRSYYMNRNWRDRVRGIGFDKAVANYKNYSKPEQSRDHDGNFLQPDISDEYLKNYKESIKALIKYTPIK